MRKLGLILIAVVLIGILGLVAVQFYLNREAEERFYTFVKETGAEAEVKSISRSLFTDEITIEGLTLKTDEGTVKVEKVVVKEIGPEALDVEIYGFSSDDEDFNKLEQDLQKIGYKKVAFNGGIKVNLNKEIRRLTLEKAYWELPEGFRVFLSADFLNFDTTLMKKLIKKDEKEISQEELMKIAIALSGIEVKSFLLKFSDLGIIPRSLDAYASEKGKDPKAVREEVVRLLEKDFPKDIADPLKKLIVKGGSIIIRSDPDKPFKLGEFIISTSLSAQTGDFSSLKSFLRIEHKEEP